MSQIAYLFRPVLDQRGTAVLPGFVDRDVYPELGDEVFATSDELDAMALRELEAAQREIVEQGRPGLAGGIVRALQLFSHRDAAKVTP